MLDGSGAEEVYCDDFAVAETYRRIVSREMSVKSSAKRYKATDTNKISLRSLVNNVVWVSLLASKHSLGDSLKLGVKLIVARV